MYSFHIFLNIATLHIDVLQSKHKKYKIIDVKVDCTRLVTIVVHTVSINPDKMYSLQKCSTTI